MIFSETFYKGSNTDGAHTNSTMTKYNVYCDWVLPSIDTGPIGACITVNFGTNLRGYRATDSDNLVRIVKLETMCLFLCFWSFHNNSLHPSLP